MANRALPDPDGSEYGLDCSPPEPKLTHTLRRKVQYVDQESDEQEVSKEKKVYIQQVLGTFLYYARAVDSTMLVALSAIASSQSAPTEETMEMVLYFMDCAASHPDAI